MTKSQENKRKKEEQVEEKSKFFLSDKADK